MPRVSDDVIFMGLILGVALFILVILLAAVVFIQYYEHRRNDKLTLRSLLDTVRDFFPKARNKKEASPGPPDTLVDQAAPEAPNEAISSGPRVAKPRWKDPSYIVSEFFRLICFIGGWINGACIILIAAPYSGESSPYYGIFKALPSALAKFLFASGFQFLLAPLSGVLLGAAIGWAAKHFFKAPNSFVRKTGFAGGIGGLLSLGIIFLNIYAS